MSDRTVHAAYPGMEIVRYDRAGKWYLEPTSPTSQRHHVGIADAVCAAIGGLDHGGRVFLNRPGGGAFDARLRKAIPDVPTGSGATDG